MPPGIRFPGSHPMASCAVTLTGTARRAGRGSADLELPRLFVRRGDRSPTPGPRHRMHGRSDRRLANCGCRLRRHAAAMAMNICQSWPQLFCARLH